MRRGVLVIFAIAQARHWNSGWRFPIAGIPVVHRAVACSFLSPMCPNLWCHSSVVSIDVLFSAIFRVIVGTGVVGGVVLFCVDIVDPGGSVCVCRGGTIVVFVMPVLPIPCVALSVTDSSSCSCSGDSLMRSSMSWAMRSPFVIFSGVCLSVLRRMTCISPR